MNHLPTGLTIFSLLLASLALGFIPGNAAATGPIGFGMDSKSIDAQTKAGVKPTYGTFWIGPWTLSTGWGAPDAELSRMKSLGITPAIHFYYWGDDISASCIENGCWSSLHDTHKTRAGWDKLAAQLVDHLNAKMGGQPVVIFLENEFNKGGVATYEPLDGYLAAKAAFFHDHYPNARIVMALGNWNSAAWGTWDRTATESDYIGLQGMRGSTKDSLTKYHGLYEATLAGAKAAKSLFGKPVFIHDIALSSYPEPDYLKHQADALRELFAGLPDLKAAGVMAIIYRTWADNPSFDLANYYGQAERHWGLAWTMTGSAKGAGNVWVAGVAAERGTTTTTTGTSSPFTATFAPKENVNEWWVDVSVKASSTPTKVDVKVNGGSWIGLSKSGWGTWTKSTNVPAGASVVFRASDAAGQTATSGTYTWLASASPFTATFAPRDNVNEWWVDVSVKASSTPTKVDVKVNGGSWIGLSKSGWGTWTKSTNVPAGSSVVFRATDAAGQTATSGTYTWLASASAFTASFTPKAQGNDWWVEAAVTGSEAINKVDARVNGGPWTALAKTSWDTWAKSVHATNGAKVEFRATATSGATATSAAYTWG